MRFLFILIFQIYIDSVFCKPSSDSVVGRRFPLSHSSSVFYKSKPAEDVVEKEHSKVEIFERRKDKSTVECFTDEDCFRNYTPRVEIALKYGTAASTPKCINSTNTSAAGFCSCEDKCLSRSFTFESVELWYCGECGRIGSQCSKNTTCDEKTSICVNGFCNCIGNGIFYQLHFCYYQYYGYEVALEVAIASCIVIAFGLLVGAVYKNFGLYRVRRLETIRNLFVSATNRGPVNDNPPKYDDVVEDLPTYQEVVRSNANLKTTISETKDDKDIQ